MKLAKHIMMLVLFAAAFGVKAGAQEHDTVCRERMGKMEYAADSTPELREHIHIFYGDCCGLAYFGPEFHVEYVEGYFLSRSVLWFPETLLEKYLGKKYCWRLPYGVEVVRRAGRKVVKEYRHNDDY